MKEKLLTVIDYLDGKIDIYDGNHQDVIQAWNAAWDEMRYMEVDSASISGIRQYIRYQLS